MGTEDVLVSNRVCMLAPTGSDHQDQYHLEKLYSKKEENLVRLGSLIVREGEANEKCGGSDRKALYGQCLVAGTERLLP